MSALGWVCMAGVLIAWALCEAWERVTSVEVLAVFEDADNITESTPIYDELAAVEAERDLTDDRIAAWLDGWSYGGGDVA